MIFLQPSIPPCLIPSVQTGSHKLLNPSRYMRTPLHPGEPRGINNTSEHFWPPLLKTSKQNLKKGTWSAASRRTARRRAAAVSVSLGGMGGDVMYQCATPSAQTESASRLTRVFVKRGGLAQVVWIRFVRRLVNRVLIRTHVTSLL